MRTSREMEDRLIALQRRFQAHQEARRPDLMAKVREEYKRLHSRWMADKAQGRL